MSSLRFVLATATLTFCAWSSTASAQDTSTEDSNASADAPVKRRAELPFASVVDATTAGRMDVTAMYSAGSARREKYVQSAIASFGATSAFAPFASVTEAGMHASGGAAGFTWRVVDGAFRLALQPSGFRGVDTTWGTSLRIIATLDVGAVRFATNLVGGHTFAPGRDALDFDVLVGTSVRVAKWTGGAFRAGFEYIGRDIEDAFNPNEADGGATHEFGPTLGLDLGRFQAVLGPTYVFHATGDVGTVGGRVAAMATF